MRWPGFRRVRSQVCKRLQRRIEQLQLKDLFNYRVYLTEHADEWAILDKICQITISRFYRDKMVFSFLGEQVFPYLVNQLEQRQETKLRIWCAGCGAGEEPYTLALLWAMQFHLAHPSIKLSIVGSDSNPQMMGRAKQAIYPYSAVKNLPSAWRETAFTQHNGQYHLLPEHQQNVKFLCQDLRKELPDGLHDLVLCRNLAFTYFNEALQREVAQRIRDNLIPGGVLMIGVHEALPSECAGFTAWSERLGIYRRQT
jgi:chemotaxis protein methyltransferase CheR